MSYEKERKIAVEAVLKASKLCASVQGAFSTEDAMSKKDKSPVTVADFGAQAVVNMDVLSHFPNDVIVGEEDAAELRDETGKDIKGKVIHHVRQINSSVSDDDILDAIDSGNFSGGADCRFWTLDPVDGTKGFLRKGQYAVALALIENGKVVLGVLGCPSLSFDGEHTGVIFIAIRGSGTFMRSIDDPKEYSVHVSDISTTAEATFCESVESGHSSHGWSADIAKQLGVTAEPYRIDSQCKYAALSRADADIYLRLPTRADYEEKIWDHGAGSIVVEEAGGKVTDIFGNPLDFSQGTTLKNNKGVIASNGKYHDEVVNAVSSTIPSELNLSK